MMVLIFFSAFPELSAGWMWFQLGLLVASLIGLWFFARWFLGWRVGGAPYLPVRDRDLKDALALVHLSSEDVVIDLGSGDGKILLAAAKQGARVIGYEINPLMVWLSRFRLRRFKSRAQVFCRDLRDADLSSGTVIVCFCITGIMPAVAERLQASARVDCKIISVAFSLPGLRLVEVRGAVKRYELVSTEAPSEGSV